MARENNRENRDPKSNDDKSRDSHVNKDMGKSKAKRTEKMNTPDKKNKGKL